MANIGIGIGVQYVYINTISSYTTISDGSIVYRKGVVSNLYVIEYSADGGVTWVELASFQPDEELLVMLVDAGLAGYRQVIRDYALCIDHELYEDGFSDAEGVGWEEDERYEYEPALIFAFNGLSYGVSNVPVTLVGWNTLLNLPANGTAFTSIEVFGNTILLRGGSGITLGTNTLKSNEAVYRNLLEIIDQIDCITSLETACIGDGDAYYYSCYNLFNAYLPAVINVEQSSFSLCLALTSINLSACTDLGGSVISTSVFAGIEDNTITLTIPSALMTCNAGNPDGDIAELQTNNTVTIVTI
jgi:hypothetical protein